MQASSVFSKLLGLKLKTQLILLLSFMVFGFAISGFLADQAYNKVLVKGDVYKQIMSDKDLAADILPPPAYLLESWQVALEMVAQKNKPLQPLIDKSNQLAKDFTDRTTYWDNNIKDPKMHDVITKKLTPTGLEFMHVRDNQLIPALRSGDAKRIDAALIDLQIVYTKHREAVDEMVVLSNEHYQKVEIAVPGQVSDARSNTLILILIALGLTIVGVYIVVNNVIRQLGGEAGEALSAAQNIADGEFKLIKLAVVSFVLF